MLEPDGQPNERKKLSSKKKKKTEDSTDIQIVINLDDLSNDKDGMRYDEFSRLALTLRERCF